MDIKKMVMAMALAMAVVIGWQFVADSMFKRHPEWRKPGDKPPVAQIDNSLPSTNPIAVPTTQQGGTTVPTTGIAAAVATQPVAPGQLEVRGAEGAPETVALGSREHGDVNFSLELATTATGAGLDEVVLNQFFSTVKKDAPYQYQRPFEGTAQDSYRPLATRWVSLNGQRFDLFSRAWTLESKTDTSVTYAVDIAPAGSTGPAGIRVRKTYTIEKRAEPRQGYEVRVLQSIENLGPLPAIVATEINGPVPPVQEIDNADDRQVIAGYKVGDSMTAVGHPFSGFTEEKPVIDLTRDKHNSPIAWVGQSSVYFDAITRPEKADEKQFVPMLLKSVSTRCLNVAEFPKTTEKRLVTTQLESDNVTLAPGQRGALPIVAFFGPKQRALLNNAYYSAEPMGYDTTLSTNIGGCGTYCAFGWLINVLVTLLGFFHYIVKDWGLAIILLVAIVRTCLHPITKRSQMSMMRMGKMGPEVEKLKARYKDNKDELNRAMMQMYKEQGAGAYLGCLPMFLQTPIWIALYTCLQNTFELRHAPFLYGFTWIHDLSKPDRLIDFRAHPVSLFFLHFDAINLLPLLMGVVFFLQQKYTPKPPATTPEQEQQQKMMQWMSVIFPVFLYNGPAGLNLYILTSTAVGIIESKRIRDHIRQRDEAEKAGRVIVEPTRKMRRDRDDDDDRSGGGLGAKRDPKPPKGGGLGGWLADLQSKAEDMKRNQDKRK